MAHKNETPALILSLLVTLGLLGAGAFWFSRQFNFTVGDLTRRTPSSPASSVSLDPGSSGNSSSSIASNTAVAQFSQVQNVPSGLFLYGGSTTWAPIRGSIDPAIQTVFPQFTLRYTDPPGSPPGSTTGIQMLLNGQLAIAQSSRPLAESEYQSAKQRGFTLQQVPVALEGIAIAVHPDLEISGLTLDQLKGIYTGQITNWSQVGGPNLAITPWSRQEEGGTVEYFKTEVMGNANFSSTVRFASNTTQALRSVASTPGSLYYASAPEVVGQCSIKPIALGRTPSELIPPYQPPLVPLSACPGQRNQLNLNAFKQGQYPLTRTLFVIVKQNGAIEQQAGEAYANLLLTGQGQDLLMKAGFVPLR